VRADTPSGDYADPKLSRFGAISDNSIPAAAQGSSCGQMRKSDHVAHPCTSGDRTVIGQARREEGESEIRTRAEDDERFH
jgi:hypothetical protein